MGKAYYLTINQTHGAKETTKVYLVLDYSFLKKNILKNIYRYFSQPESPKGLLMCPSLNTFERILPLELFYFCTFFWVLRAHNLVAAESGFSGQISPGTLYPPSGVPVPGPERSQITRKEWSYLRDYGILFLRVRIPWLPGKKYRRKLTVRCSLYPKATTRRDFSQVRFVTYTPSDLALLTELLI